MITIFNRKELTLTYDMATQAKIREVLSANQIDYKVNPGVTYPNINRSQTEYKFYVKKADYARASHLIRDVF